MDSLSRYLKPGSRHVGKAICLLAATVGAGSWFVSQALDQYAAARAIESRAVRLRALAAKPVDVAPSRAEQEEHKRWASLKAERAFSWAPLFDALESIGNPDIELLELHPDKASGQVVLRGEAKTEETLVAFVEALAAQRAFDHVYLTHWKVKVHGGFNSIAFEVKTTLAAKFAGGVKKTED